jgi:proline iminopeptidase
MPYPPIQPYATRRLAVAAPHTLYVEECGDPVGAPAVVLHGGPGSGCKDDLRRLLDPAFYRIVLFDQRGSGRSEPGGCTLANRTGDLVGDLERIRRALGIDRWLVLGGSWGATLALRYAQVHPTVVSGLVLRGVFLARERDLDWFLGADGAARLFPADWQVFSGMIPESERGDLAAAYYRRVHGPDMGDDALAFARAWSAWEDRVATWTLPGEQGPTAAEGGGGAVPDRLLARVRIATHYARHRYFIGANQILEQATRLPAVPVSIVHGGRDLVCPIESAWALHRAIPDSRLIVVPSAGHLSSEPAMADALVGETDRFRDLLL